MLTFMDIESYEQLELPLTMVGEQKAFLQDGMEVTLEIVDNKPIGVDLPEQVVQRGSRNRGCCKRPNSFIFI